MINPASMDILSLSIIVAFARHAFVFASNSASESVKSVVLFSAFACVKLYPGKGWNSTT